MKGKQLKRNAVVAAVAVFICVAAYLNWSYVDQGEAASAGKTLGEAALVSSEESTEVSLNQEGSAETGYFENARLSRQVSRDSALTILQTTVDDPAAAAAAVEEASAAITTMAAETVSESQIENLVIAKGYADCIVYLGTESASVVVSTVEGGMTDTDVAKITDIVIDETGLAANQIKVMEADP